MTFQTVPLQIVGATSQNRSKQASNAMTKNWYPQLTPDGRSEAILLPWWGTKAFGTSPKTTHRGRHVFQDVLYQVAEDTLYSISSTGTYTSIGSISGSDRCIFDDNGDFMVITTGGDTYSYDGTTLTTATDPDFQSPASNTMLNNQWIYDGTGEKFWVSDAGDPLTLAALNNAEAESRGDPLSRAYAFKQWVYLFGTESIEPWYNSGVGDPPFDRMFCIKWQKIPFTLYQVLERILLLAVFLVLTVVYLMITAISWLLQQVATRIRTTVQR